MKDYATKVRKIRAKQIKHAATQDGPPSSKMFKYEGESFVVRGASLPVVGDYLELTDFTPVHWTKAAFEKEFTEVG